MAGGGAMGQLVCNPRLGACKDGNGLEVPGQLRPPEIDWRLHVVACCMYESWHLAAVLRWRITLWLHYPCLHLQLVWALVQNVTSPCNFVSWLQCVSAVGQKHSPNEGVDTIHSIQPSRRVSPLLKGLNSRLVPYRPCHWGTSSSISNVFGRKWVHFRSRSICMFIGVNIMCSKSRGLLLLLYCCSFHIFR